MDKQTQNTEKYIREKFEEFAPTPPPKIWEGVQKGIAANNKPAFFSAYRNQIAVAASVLLLALLSLWWFIPNNSETEALSEKTKNSITNQENIITSQNANKDVHNIADASSELNKTQEKPSETLETSNEITKKIASPASDVTTVNLVNESSENTEVVVSDSKNKTTIVVVPVQSVETNQSESKIVNDQSYENSYLSKSQISSIPSLQLNLENETSQAILNKTLLTPELTAKSPAVKNNGWSHGIYLSPEFMLNEFDSVELLPTYSLNYEPSYHFSNHFFLRFGLGLSYTRDRGFAKIDYISNEVVGTYEDVYDITFDSIDGKVVPTYYTKTTDVWDSVRHLQITEITNKYVYLQTPVLFGYYKKNTKINWYFYAGPAINILINKQIEEPQNNLEDADIIDLSNNLPERSPYFMQLWVGAGIEYKVGKKMAVTFEPNYRYYFNNVFKEDQYKTALSGFSLRFGIVFNMK